MRSLLIILAPLSSTLLSPLFLPYYFYLFKCEKHNFVYCYMRKFLAINYTEQSSC
jgi:hypothetical protein